MVRAASVVITTMITMYMLDSPEHSCSRPVAMKISIGELQELMRALVEYGELSDKVKKSKKLEDRSAFLRKEVAFLETALTLYKKQKKKGK